VKLVDLVEISEISGLSQAHRLCPAFAYYGVQAGSSAKGMPSAQTLAGPFQAEYNSALRFATNFFLFRLQNIQREIVYSLKYHK